MRGHGGATIQSRATRNCAEFEAILDRILAHTATESEQILVCHVLLRDLLNTDLHVLYDIEQWLAPKGAKPTPASRACTQQAAKWLRANFEGAAEGSTWTYDQKAAIMIKAAMISGSITDPWVRAPPRRLARTGSVAGPCATLCRPHFASA